jgi:hypothetical protein
VDNGLSAEDGKLVILARSSRARIGAREGAAVRDTDGRTYVAAAVDLPSLQLSAVQACVAMAVSSGSRYLEAAVVLGAASDAAPEDLVVLADLATNDFVLHVADPHGTIVASHGLGT